ncbi:MAG TPA: hypothetical protein VMW46_08785 [Candidatus Desulfaltia sp.]|nr:hypothetical protein [Candidatus Desulfaltia sp.]
MRTARLLTLAGLLSVACLGSGGETRTVVVTVLIEAGLSSDHPYL